MWLLVNGVAMYVTHTHTHAHTHKKTFFVFKFSNKNFPKIFSNKRCKIYLNNQSVCFNCYIFLNMKKVFLMNELLFIINELY